MRKTKVFAATTAALILAVAGCATSYAASLANRLVSCLVWIFDHGRLMTGTLLLAASLIALYWYGYLGVVFGWLIAAILLVGLVAWVYIARLTKDAIGEFVVLAVRR